MSGERNAEPGDVELVNKYQKYQSSFNQRCVEWRNEPVEDRKRNDVCCIVTFFVLLIGFIGFGIYYISKYNSLPVMPNSTASDELFITKYVGQITASMAIALISSFLYIFLVKIMPKVMVYAMIAISLGLMLTIAVIGLIIGEIAIFIPFGIIFLVYCLVLYCLRDKIGLGIVIIKVASQFITEKPAIYISPLIKIALTFVTAVFWIYTVSCILAVLDHKHTQQQDNTMEYVMAFVWVLLWLFFSFLFYYIMVFTIAVACSFWYYQVEGKNFLTTAYRWIAQSSFGSIVFASLLIAIITFARMIVDGQRRNSKNAAVAVCLCLVSCLLKSIEDLVKILNHTSVIVMSVTGQSYVQAAKTTIGILSQNFALMAIANTITNLLVFWGVIITTCSSALIGYFLLKTDDGITNDDISSSMLLIVFGSLMISIIILAVLVESVSAVYIFYCFDYKFKELGYGGHNMPEDINQALGNYNLGSKNQY